MQIFANSKRHFHSFIEFFVIRLKNQEVKICVGSGLAKTYEPTILVCKETAENGE